MKKSLLALSAGLVFSVAGTSAFANSGTIMFQGKITAATCPIEISPPGGGVGSAVPLGEVAAAQFTAVGQEYNRTNFELVVKDGAACGFNNSTANFTFTGAADTSGNYFAVTPTSDGALGVSIALRDDLGKDIAPGATSDDFDVNDIGETRIRFNASYRSTAATVTAGAANADVGFTAAFN
ncbi:type 1 fimbrial protein [Pseudomonas sichuanensis]|uniref:fimbrial protein n=1 Tax=Pseudomonas sichuanensis TaxID=2213015 RepID=UPI00244728B9|nr:fimbrial protein [Pseudomonas sichuanensis]MDH0730396.1 type 1 fimbrial protein [Pseudomonas sichuanensis]MDH1583673.1 type 1 fimbrial protein [Pseudomonas sichuanensis]MDH1594220.1 type 1 fimbrial protein [Pseudomonas sichuanensis]MDH1597845.1 type 1 fimbrial protein [Pseudomonas sichuanensis]